MFPKKMQDLLGLMYEKHVTPQWLKHGHPYKAYEQVD
jgi:hypothetical protein